MEGTKILSLETLMKVKEELFKLISIPSHRDFKPILEYLENRLSYIDFERQSVEGKGYNLIHVSPEKPVLINTHVDTVPPITMKNPFTPVEKDEKIYGRGAADTKGLIASLIVALDMFKDAFPNRDIPASLAFTVDEEQNSALGSEKLLEKLDGIKYALVLEPTYGMLCNKQMGTLEFSIKISLPSAHASEFERFENPIRTGFEIINKLEKVLNRKVNIIQFKGGWKHYAVPGRAEILAEVKVYEYEKAKQIEDKIKSLINTEYKDKAVYIHEDVEDFIHFNEGYLFKTLSRAYEYSLNRKPEKGIMPSWTDAANFKKKDIECVIFGFGNLADCHTEREHITLKELESMTAVLYSFFSILNQSR